MSQNNTVSGLIYHISERHELCKLNGQHRGCHINIYIVIFRWQVHLRLPSIFMQYTIMFDQFTKQYQTSVDVLWDMHP